MSKKIKIILVVAVAMVLISVGYLYYDYENKKSEVVFFDVGQGDSILINLPGNNEILIDGGPDKTVLKKLGRYLPFYERTIELLILTHPHDDHVAGLIEVLKRYQVKRVVYAEIKYDSDFYREFLNNLKSGQNVKRIKASEAEKINFSDDYFLKFIYPFDDLDQKFFKDVNDSSIVVKLDTQDKDFLFTGDISIQVEEEILKKSDNLDLKADVLKIAHHGSNNSSSQKFLEAVKPKLAVISVGENKFGHPALRVIRRLERLGAEILKTDENGDVAIKIKDD